MCSVSSGQTVFFVVLAGADGDCEGPEGSTEQPLLQATALASQYCLVEAGIFGVI